MFTKAGKCDQCDKRLKDICYLKVHKQNHAKKIGENMEVSVNPEESSCSVDESMSNENFV